jgi:hypothetical protein
MLTDYLVYSPPQKEELIKAYCEIIFFQTKIQRTNEESVFTHLGLAEAHLQF